MGRVVIINFIRFFLLIATQVFLLKNIGYYNLSIPYLYILFILLLPFGIPNWLLFFLAFSTGITIDVFYDTLGLNAAACTVMAFIRIIYISITVQRDGFDNEPEPSLGAMGFRWFIFYSTILTISHHFILFTFENFKFGELGYTLIRVLLSSIFTVTLILISEFAFFSKKTR
ncbi:rod shape-determining protein MreD [Daejeonella sp.]|uniref:rod shape-determining protein MreD n=1 Tax=Daejeonella sp. TaxID=2805397 RepID=UPI0025BA0DB1|nr:rod shape-determining protein MreD [Daejeonella sp.]